MSDKSKLCVGCGRWKESTTMVDTGDGDGILPTCDDCVEQQKQARNSEGARS